MTILFHIKILVKKTNIDAPFKSISLEKLIPIKLIKKLGLEVLKMQQENPNLIFP